MLSLTFNSLQLAAISFIPKLIRLMGVGEFISEDRLLLGAIAEEVVTL